MTVAVDQIAGRWGIQHTRYNWAQCRFCGRAGQAPNPDCSLATCPACGSRQCASKHECAVCYVGLIPGWSGSRQQCGYARCDKPAVAKAPRVKFVCTDDLGRATRRWAGKTVTLADDIAERIAIRDGKVRPPYLPIRFVWMPEVAA